MGGPASSSRAIAAATIIGAIAAAPPAAAAGRVRPCRPGTTAHAASSKALDALDADIRKLAPAADPAPLARRIEELGKQGCFSIVGGLRADAKSGLALRTWWEDGGHAFAAGAIALTGEEPIVWVAPDVRRALTRETAPAHRLAPLLCPAYDEACGRDTDGWRLRAEAALERAARVRHLEGDAPGPLLAGGPRERPRSEADCAAYGRKAPRHRQLSFYRQCLETTAPRAPAFAIGRVKKPTEGWLVVSGRRGHYAFCDELRAFDLATGSAYRVASCSGLALISDGSVDHRATDAARKLDRERGTVSLDEIREAAWMLLQLGELDESVLTDGFGQALPKGIALENDDADLMFGGGLLSVTASSGNTTLQWQVTANTRQLGGGEVTWPRDLNDDAEAHAVELLEVAEASFVAGCPPTAPPPEVAAQLDKLSANRLDTDARSLGQAASSLSTSWRDLLGESCMRVTPRAPR